MHSPQSRWARGPGRKRRLARPSTARLQQILDSVADGVVVADQEGRFLLFNPAAERILGIGLMDVPQQDWPSVWGCYRPDGVTPFPADELPLACALRGETVTGAEVFIRNASTPAGVWLSVNATPLRGPGGRLEGGVIVFRDVTVLKQEMRQVELLSNVVEQTADGVLVTDARGRIEYVNPAFERITGYSREELLGRTPAVLKSGEHGLKFYAGLWRRLMSGEVFRGTIKDRRKSGEVFLAEQTITPVRGPAGGFEHLVSVAKDVTSLRRAEQQEHALQVARRVQQRLFPSAPPSIRGLDIHGRAFVADATGGDYFDFIPLPGECLGLVIGDVSGHGLDSALVMAELRAVVRATARTVSEVGESLSVVNRVLVADTEDARFATLLLAVLHLPSRSLRYANAGHPPGYVLDASGRVKLQLGALGPPLGLFSEAAFSSHDGLRLSAGDSLVLFTDGVTESESPAGTPFGLDRLLEVVRARRGAPASSLVEAIRDAVQEFTDRAPLQDDLTVVVCSVEEA